MAYAQVLIFFPLCLLQRSLNAIEDFEYRKVKVTGTFRHDQEILLGPRTRGDGQPGYFLITPFERTKG